MAVDLAPELLAMSSLESTAKMVRKLENEKLSPFPVQKNKAIRKIRRHVAGLGFDESELRIKALFS